MAHEIENMFSVEQTPWHGLGTVVQQAPTAEQAIRLAGLAWTVMLRPLQLADGTPAIPWSEPDPDATDAPRPHNTTVRSTDGRILGVVGPEYQPLQNDRAFAWFDPWVTSGQASYTTAGSLRGGRKVWVLASLNMDPLDVVRGDAVRPFVLLSNAHDGSMSVRVGFTPIRVVCANTLAAAHSDAASKLLRVKHTSGVEEATNAIRGIMDVVRGEFATTAEQWRHLASKDLDKRTLEGYIRSVFRASETGAALARTDGDAEPEGKRVVPRVVGLIEGGLRGDKLLPAASTERLTWWRAYNAVTEYVDHVRGTDGAARLDSAWFGQGASLKRRAMDLAVKFSVAA